MFFINIDTEKMIQVNDRFRIDLSLSTGTVDHSPIEKVEIKPAASESFFQVSDALSPLDSTKWYLDWEYSTDGEKTITAQFTFEDTTVLNKEIIIDCITATEDGLFSNDDDLKIHENNISGFLSNGKTSFLNFHRRAQTLIINELDRKGFRLEDGSKITKTELLDKSEFHEWSTLITLRLIFESVSNARDDIFSVKSAMYSKMEQIAKNKAFLIYDFDKDGTLSQTDNKFIGSVEVIR